jgi:hypothetical protein
VNDAAEQLCVVRRNELKLRNVGAVYVRALLLPAASTGAKPVSRKRVFFSFHTTQQYVCASLMSSFL